MPRPLSTLDVAGLRHQGVPEHTLKRLGRRKLFGAEERARIKGAVFRRDGHQCVYCGRASELQLDHVDPDGPDDDLRNLAAACATCNQSKGSRTPQEWAASQAPKLPGMMRAGL